MITRSYLLNNGWKPCIINEKNGALEVSWISIYQYTKTVDNIEYQIHFISHEDNKILIKKYTPCRESFSFGIIDFATNEITNFPPIDDNCKQEIILYTGPNFDIEILKQHYNFL